MRTRELSSVWQLSLAHALLCMPCVYALCNQWNKCASQQHDYLMLCPFRTTLAYARFLRTWCIFEQHLSFPASGLALDRECMHTSPQNPTPMCTLANIQRDTQKEYVQVCILGKLAVQQFPHARTESRVWAYQWCGAGDFSTSLVWTLPRWWGGHFHRRRGQDLYRECHDLTMKSFKLCKLVSVSRTTSNMWQKHPHMIKKPSQGASATCDRNIPTWSKTSLHSFLAFTVRSQPPRERSWHLLLLN